MLDADATRILKGRSFAHLALVDHRSRPHVTPVWVDLEDELVVVNTAEGRVKAKLMQLGTPVALSATDPDTPYRYVAVRGTVVERTHEGADEMINRLARKYLGRDFTPRSHSEQRVTVRIRPDHVYVY